MIKQKILDEPELVTDDELNELVEAIVRVGHKMSIFEAFSIIQYGDYNQCAEFAKAFKEGRHKALIDRIAKRLNEIGWKKRKVLRDRSRRLRWVNPALDNTDYDTAMYSGNSQPLVGGDL